MKPKTKVTAIIGKYKNQVGIVVSSKGHNVSASSVAVKFGDAIVVCELSILKKTK